MEGKTPVKHPIMCESHSSTFQTQPHIFVFVSLKGCEQTHGQNLQLGLLQHAAMKQKPFFISVSKFRPGRIVSSKQVKGAKQVCAFSTPTFPRLSLTEAAPPWLVSRLSQDPHSRLLSSFWTFLEALGPRWHSCPPGASSR